MEILAENGVPYLDLREIFKNEPETHDRMFYQYDTHWTAEYVFHGFCALSEYLRGQGVEIESELTDIQSYSVSSRGYEPTDLWDRIGFPKPSVPFFFLDPKMKPKIQIDRIDSPTTQFHYAGPFSERIVREYYSVDTVVVNEDSPNRKTILFFSDSFGKAFISFLALSCHRLDAHMMNHFHGDLLQRIEEVKPDYVVALFTARDTIGLCEKISTRRKR